MTAGAESHNGRQGTNYFEVGKGWTLPELIDGVCYALFQESTLSEAAVEHEISITEAKNYSSEYRTRKQAQDSNPLNAFLNPPVR